MKIKTLDDLKGKGYRRATVEGVKYRVQYDFEGYRPLDVQGFSGTGEVIKLSRAVRKHVLDILEERMLKRFAVEPRVPML